jgi:hypothetical protein
MRYRVTISKKWMWSILVLCSCLFIPSHVFPDIGRKPTLTLSFSQDDLPMQDAGWASIIVCWDVFIAGGDPEGAISEKNYALIKPFIASAGIRSCRLYRIEEGKIKQWFYELPGRLLVLYPSYEYYHYLPEYSRHIEPDRPLVEEDISPQLYLSENVRIGRSHNFDYWYQVTLHSDHTATLIDTTPYSTAYTYQSLIQVLIVTLLIELAFAVLYFEVHVRCTSNRVKCWIRFLSSVCIANLLSLSANHFILFRLVPSYIIALLIAETVAIVSESIVIKNVNKNVISWSFAMKLSVWMNLISVLLGTYLILPILESLY